jgi:hypothetical protein
MNLYRAILAAALLFPSIAAAQVVLPSQCPQGFRHEGAYCVGEEGGAMHRIPYNDFLRGGRYWGRPFPRGSMVVHRPVVRRPIAHGPVVIRRH